MNRSRPLLHAGAPKNIGVDPISKVVASMQLLDGVMNSRRLSKILERGHAVTVGKTIGGMKHLKFTIRLEQGVLIFYERGDCPDGTPSFSPAMGVLYRWPNFKKIYGDFIADKDLFFEDVAGCIDNVSIEYEDALLMAKSEILDQKDPETIYYFKD